MRTWIHQNNKLQVCYHFLCGETNDKRFYYNRFQCKQIHDVVVKHCLFDFIILNFISFKVLSVYNFNFKPFQTKLHFTYIETPAVKMPARARCLFESEVALQKMESLQLQDDQLKLLPYPLMQTKFCSCSVFKYLFEPTESRLYNVIVTKSLKH